MKNFEYNWFEELEEESNNRFAKDLCKVDSKCIANAKSAAKAFEISERTLHQEAIAKARAVREAKAKVKDEIEAELKDFVIMDIPLQGSSRSSFEFILNYFRIEGPVGR
jgi:hypothetical protein